MPLAARRLRALASTHGSDYNSPTRSRFGESRHWVIPTALFIALALVAVVAALAIGYAFGRARQRAEAASMRRSIANRDAMLPQLRDFADDRHRLFAALATARAETARYRQLVVDLENNAPLPLLGGPGMPDDLKLIVGVGPMLERMLHQLGITTYRQIARWTERDIDDFDARLPEFPGRIRRDAWVTQAGALHQSTHGETLPSREPR